MHVIELAGELDAFNTPELRERLSRLIEEDDELRVLVVDLSQVSFLDSTVLGTLVGALRRMRERGGELQLVYPAHPVSRIFTLTGLDAVFPEAERVV
jgi:anti-sigma B factor antagonist